MPEFKPLSMMRQWRRDVIVAIGCILTVSLLIDAALLGGALVTVVILLYSTLSEMIQSLGIDACRKQRGENREDASGVGRSENSFTEVEFEEAAQTQTG